MHCYFVDDADLENGEGGDGANNGGDNEQDPENQPVGDHEREFRRIMEERTNPRMQKSDVFEKTRGRKFFFRILYVIFLRRRMFFRVFVIFSVFPIHVISFTTKLGLKNKMWKLSKITRKRGYNVTSYMKEMCAKSTIFFHHKIPTIARDIIIFWHCYKNCSRFKLLERQKRFRRNRKNLRCLQEKKLTNFCQQEFFFFRETDFVSKTVFLKELQPRIEPKRKQEKMRVKTSEKYENSQKCEAILQK